MKAPKSLTLDATEQPGLPAPSQCVWFSSMKAPGLIYKLYVMLRGHHDALFLYLFHCTNMRARLAGPFWTPRGWGLAVSPPELTPAAALHDDSSKSSKPSLSNVKLLRFVEPVLSA